MTDHGIDDDRRAIRIFRLAEEPRDDLRELLTVEEPAPPVETRVGAGRETGCPCAESFHAGHDPAVEMTEDWSDPLVALAAPVEGGETRPYLEAPWSEESLRVSPDRRYAAYISFEGGNRQIWIRDYPTPTRRWQVSTGVQANEPVWAPDGGSIYVWQFTRGAEFSTGVYSLHRATVDRTGSDLKVAAPAVPGFAMNVQGWDLHPDGSRVVIAQYVPTAADSAPPHFFVTLNWLRDMEARGVLEAGHR